MNNQNQKFQNNQPTINRNNYNNNNSRKNNNQNNYNKDNNNLNCFSYNSNQNNTKKHIYKKREIKESKPIQQKIMNNRDQNRINKLNIYVEKKLKSQSNTNNNNQNFNNDSNNNYFKNRESNQKNSMLKIKDNNADNNQQNINMTIINPNIQKNEEIFKDKMYIPSLKGSFLCTVVRDSSIIDSNESNIIQSIIQLNYTNFKKKEKQSLSSKVSDAIQKKLGGRWFVLVSNVKQQLFYNITTISNSDFLVLKFGSTKFNVAKISD